MVELKGGKGVRKTRGDILSRKDGTDQKNIGNQRRM